jgi:AraC-like DNA-binding protein
MIFAFDERPSDAPLVQKVWRTRSEQAGSFMSRAVSHWEMVVWQHHGTTHVALRGPETMATIADCPADAEFLGIQFKLGAFMPHLRAACLVNSAQPLPEASRASFWLDGTAWELPTFDNADTFVARLVRDGILVQDPVVAAVLDQREPYLSPRAIQYRFVRATGLTHNAIQQIERANQAAALLACGRSIADTVFETGFFDQAHLTRSLKRLIGQTPAEILRASQPA